MRLSSRRRWANNSGSGGIFGGYPEAASNHAAANRSLAEVDANAMCHG